MAIALWGLSSLALAADDTNVDQVWVWFTKCAHPRTIQLEMHVDGHVVHRSRFSSCFAWREDLNSQSPRKIIAFPMASAKSRFGEPPGSSFEVNVWEAGGEADGMVLGLSFRTKDRIWLNTLHYAMIDEASRSEFASGIVVTTSPVGRRAK